MNERLKEIHNRKLEIKKLLEDESVSGLEDISKELDDLLVEEKSILSKVEEEENKESKEKELRDSNKKY